MTTFTPRLIQSNVWFLDHHWVYYSIEKENFSLITLLLKLCKIYLIAGRSWFFDSKTSI